MGLNLHGIVNPIIQAVNANIVATVRESTGYTIGANAKQVPTYNDIPGVSLQVQAVSWTDLRKVDGLNLQGVFRSCYAYGFHAGIIRALKRGGDLVLFPDGALPEGNTWLIKQDLEVWADWVKFLIVLQNNGDT